MAVMHSTVPIDSRVQQFTALLRDIEEFLRYVTLIAARLYLRTSLLTLTVIVYN